MNSRFGNMAQFGALPGFFMPGREDPSKDAMEYLHRIPGDISKYYDPYINAGTQSLPILQNQFNELLNSPGGMVNRIGQGFQQSPGFKFALNQALQGAGHAAAAGGMAGSPMHEQQNMEIATQLGNQDYYNWLNKSLGLYGMGLEGERGLAAGGLQAGSSMADQIAQMLAAKAKLSYESALQENQATSGNIGNLLQGVGTLAAFL